MLEHQQRQRRLQRDGKVNNESGADEDDDVTSDNDDSPVVDLSKRWDEGNLVDQVSDWAAAWQDG